MEKQQRGKKNRWGVRRGDCTESVCPECTVWRGPPLEWVMPSFLKEKIKKFNRLLILVAACVTLLSFLLLPHPAVSNVYSEWYFACNGGLTILWALSIAVYMYISWQGWRIANTVCSTLISINELGANVSRVILPLPFNWRNLGCRSWTPWHLSKSPRLLWNSSRVRHDIRAAWHQFELLISGGKNYEWLRSQVIVSNESVAHSPAFFSQGLNADCLDRLNSCVITKLSRRLIFQSTHSPPSQSSVI